MRPSVKTYDMDIHVNKLNKYSSKVDNRHQIYTFLLF